MSLTLYQINAFFSVHDFFYFMFFKTQIGELIDY